MSGSGRPHADPRVGVSSRCTMLPMTCLPGLATFEVIDRTPDLSAGGVVGLTGLYSHSLPTFVHRPQGCPSLLLSHLHSSQSNKSHRCRLPTLILRSRQNVHAIVERFVFDPASSMVAIGVENK